MWSKRVGHHLGPLDLWGQAKEQVIFAGLMNEAELEQFKKTSTLKDINWWIPFHWAYNLIYRAKIEGKLPEGSANKLQDVSAGLNAALMDCWTHVLTGRIGHAAEMLGAIFTRKFGLGFGFGTKDAYRVLFQDWIPIPMVYTQVRDPAVSEGSEWQGSLIGCHVSRVPLHARLTFWSPIREEGRSESCGFVCACVSVFASHILPGMAQGRPHSELERSGDHMMGRCRSEKS